MLLSLLHFSPRAHAHRYISMDISMYVCIRMDTNTDTDVHMDMDMGMGLDMDMGLDMGLDMDMCNMCMCMSKRLVAGLGEKAEDFRRVDNMFLQPHGDAMNNAFACTACKQCMHTHMLGNRACARTCLQTMHVIVQVVTDAHAVHKMHRGGEIAGCHHEPTQADGTPRIAHVGQLA
jgi:hypothetical protein